MDDKRGMEDLNFRMPTRQRIEKGQMIKGTVVLVSDKDVFLDVGTKSEATLDVNEVTNKDGVVEVKVGDKLEAYVVEVEPELLLSRAMARAHLSRQALEDAHDLGIPVEGRVTAVNKGGLEVDLAGTRGFCPISQVEMGFCEDPNAFIGLSLKFRITEYAEGGRNVVLSRRALLEEERAERAAEIESQLQEGAEFEGTVVSLQPYGAFVDIGGVQGMVHISEICHQRIEHPSEVLRQGQTVRVRVLRLEPDKKHKDRMRVGLSIRQLLGDPWDDTVAALDEGSTVSGEVVRLQPFGAFVSIAPGVDGLVHISELSDRRVNHPGDVVEVGQKVTATVLKVDRGQKRISLSLRGGGMLSGGAGGGEELTVGTVTDVVVDKVKPFGLLVNLKGFGRSARGLIPAEETGLGRQGNLRRAYPEGSELKAMVTQVDPDTGKIRLSIKAIDEQMAQEDYGAYMDGSEAESGAPTRPGKPAKQEKPSLGTLGDLLKNSLRDK